MKGARGTCQVCGRSIGNARGTIAHHGYKRPSFYHGMQTSSCHGAGHPPFEVARDVLGRYIAMIARSIDHLDDMVKTMHAKPSRICVRAGRHRYGAPNEPAVWCELEDPFYARRQREWFAARANERRMHEAEAAAQQTRYDAWVPAAAAAA